jgi:tetratricopeptide (TPR) repeat protein
MTTVFVGRQEESTKMMDFLERVARTGPRVLLVEGPAGVGKSSLMREFLHFFRGSWSGRRGPAGLVRCHSQVGMDNAYEPIVEAVEQLSPRSRRWRTARLGARIAVESGSELVAGVMPVAGPALRVGVGVLRRSRFAKERDAVRSVQGLAGAALDAVGRGRVAVLAVDDAHLIDASSCLVLERLATAPSEHLLAIVLGVRPDEIGADGALRETLDRLTIQGKVERLALSGFSTAAIAEYVRAVSGVAPEAADCVQLRRVTGGLPFFMGQYLSLLREDGWAPMGNQWVHFPVQRVPPPVELVIRQRIQRLDQHAVELLVLGAVQGERFLSVIVERLSSVPHEEVLEQLYRVQKVSGLIRPCPHDDWTRRTGSDVYEFDHALLHRVLYEWQSPQLRRDRHAATAAVLEDLIRTTAGATLEHQLEIVHHYHHGDQFDQAARQALAVANSLVAEGGSLSEAERLCRQALEDSRRMPAGREADRLKAEIIELLLLSTEHKWNTLVDFQRITPLEALIDEASEAAERGGDLRLRVRIAVLRGRVIHKTRGVDAGLDAQRQAVALTVDGDSAMRFLTLSTYGRELTKRDLHAGLDVLREAEHLAEETPEIHDSSDLNMRHAYFRAKMQIGVSLFDAAQLGEAKTRLEAIATRLRSTDDAGTLPTALNYLAQVQLAIGLWSEARATLRDAAQLSHDEPHAWHANNLALLGKLMVDQGEVEAGLDRMRAAWAEIQQAWQANLATLVANLYAEALLDSRDGHAERAAQALDLITANIAECRRAGMIRSEVSSYSLLARLRLAADAVDDAYAASQQAVQLLEDHAPLPALRAEEVLCHHGQVLLRLDRQAEAEGYFRRAKELVLVKAQSLDGALRERFLAEVPLNALVMAAA